MKKVIALLKNWTLPIAIVSGVVGYFIYDALVPQPEWRQLTNRAIGYIQPTLIFWMLLISFCRTDTHDVAFCKWQGKLLLLQGLICLGISAAILCLPPGYPRILLEGTMILFICPTATAAPVVTGKLGGNALHITTYILLINAVASFLIPLTAALIHPDKVAGNVLTSILLILNKVFPVLLVPYLLAIIMRHTVRSIHSWLARHHNLAFYIWAVALTMAIAVTTKSIVHAALSLMALLTMAGVSLACCIAQFALGRHIGRPVHEPLTVGQALGQKNTVFAIWVGYTFFTPVTAIFGGFYAVWHNLINAYQLYRAKSSSLPVADNRQTTD